MNLSEGAVLEQIQNGLSRRSQLAASGPAQLRQEVRQACPPASRTTHAIDMVIAERLLNDLALYEAALGPAIR